MKKNFKKIFSLAFALIFALLLNTAAFASNISADSAKAVALQDAGYDVSDVLNLNAHLSYDDGIKYYDVGFYVRNANGGYYEYDYDIRVSDGKILEKDVEKENALPTASDAEISADEAKAIALKHFAVDVNDVKFLLVSKDFDDGRAVYEVEFCKPYEVKYSCEVSAYGGFVTDFEQEAVRGLYEKIELFFELLFSSIFKV